MHLESSRITWLSVPDNGSDGGGGWYGWEVIYQPEWVRRLGLSSGMDESLRTCREGLD